MRKLLQRFFIKKKIEKPLEGMQYDREQIDAIGKLLANQKQRMIIASTLSN